MNWRSGSARLVRVNGIAPATVVAGSTMFPRDRVIQSLEKYKIEYSETESTEELRDKLANYYAQRTLTKRRYCHRTAPMRSSGWRAIRAPRPRAT